jgi:hypothetical protein
MSNLSDLINNITDASKDEQDDIGNLIGTMADLSGAIGFIQLVSQLLGAGEPDLSAIQSAIENGFAQLGKVEEGNQILQRNTTLNGYIGPALTQLQTVQERTKDVYVGVGLRNVWQVIGNLNALVGDPPLSGTSFGDWSFREILGLSNLAPTSGGYSLRALGEFIIGTEPLDTPYTPGATAFSFQTLLTDFPN